MRLAVFSLALLAAACSEPEMSEAERQEIVAEVKAAQIVPAEEVSLEAIDFADIEAAELFGAGCNFMRPRVSGKSDLLFIGMEDIGAIKLDGQLQQLAPDKGSTKLPYLGWAKYDGTTHSVRLSMGEESSTQPGGEVTDYNGSIALRDGRDRVVFEETGTIQCGA